MVNTIKKQLAAARDNPQEPSRVFVISTYVIGKERILLAVRWLSGSNMKSVMADFTVSSLLHASP